MYYKTGWKNIDGKWDYLLPGADKHDVRLFGKLSRYETAKDWSKSCFPGDHGMCLIIFCVYMLRYFGFKSFLAGLLITVLFSLPRVMSGAHWISDIAVGAVTVNLVVLSWILLTPVSDFIIASLMKLLRWKMPSSVQK